MNERLDQELRARVGQILAEKYRLVQLIGIGGMGAVYSAVNEWTHRPVAIKLLHTSRSAKHLLRFFREAQVTSKLDHPSIVKVFDLGKAGDGSYFLVQELLNGESMHELLARGALGLQQTMELTFPIMGALAAAHGAGVIHRDLKPANIILHCDAEGVLSPVLIDFGISKVLAEEHDTKLTQDLLGTPAYMAPEQALNEKDIGPAADVWAMGAMLYRCLTGQPLFDGPPLTVVLLTTTQDPTPLEELAPHIPHSVADVIRKSLLRDRAQRTPTMEGLMSELLACPEVRDSDWGNELEHRFGEHLSAVVTLPFTPAISDDMDLDDSLIDQVRAILGTELARSEPAGVPTRDRLGLSASLLNTIEGEPSGESDTLQSDVVATVPIPLSQRPTIGLHSLPRPELGRSEPARVLTPKAEVSEPEAVRPARGRSGLLFGAAFGVVLVCALAVFFFLRPESPSRETPETVPEVPRHFLVEACADWTVALLGQQHETGGFSGLLHLSTSGWATAQTLAALHTANNVCGPFPEAALRRGEAALETFEQPGGWGEFGDGAETPAAAWVVVSAIARYQRGEADALEQLEEARRFLWSTQRANGGFADPLDPSTDGYQSVIATWSLYVAESVLPASAEDVSRRRAVAWLRAALREAIETHSGPMAGPAGLVAHAALALLLASQSGETVPQDRDLIRSALQRMVEDCKFSEDELGPKCSRSTKVNDRIQIHVPNDERSGVIAIVWVPWTLLCVDTMLADASLLQGEERLQAERLYDGLVRALDEDRELIRYEVGFALSEWVYAVSTVAARRGAR